MCSLNSFITKSSTFLKMLPKLNRFSNSALCSSFPTKVKHPEDNNTKAESDWKPSSKVSSDEGEEFRHLIRYSNFVNMGDPENKVIRGKIFHITGNDLYIDFGWKFHCVCSRPNKNGELYVRGAEVLLRIKSLELSSHFLGSDAGLTLLEADANIIKLLSSPAQQSTTNPQQEER